MKRSVFSLSGSSVVRAPLSEQASLQQSSKGMTRLAAGLSVLLVCAVPVQAAVDVTGAGASFPAPLYAKWADEYQKSGGHHINYQSVGSGAGIKQIQAKTVDFGASDMPLAAADLEQSGLLQFPTIIGGVVPVITVAGVASGEMKLSGLLLADIYLGKITKWNDAAIQQLNPKLKLPAADIAVLRRSDGSGTSFVFTHYLSQISPEWKEKVGEGTMVQWPVGLGGKGNEGVAAFLKQTPNAIGYVEYAYAKQGKLAVTQLQNAAGQFVQPEAKAFKAAAAGAKWEQDNYGVVLTNQSGKEAWPLTSASFVLLHKQTDKPAQTAAALHFFHWAYQKGEKAADALDYVALPESLTRNIEKLWQTNLKDASGKTIEPK